MQMAKCAQTSSVVKNEIVIVCQYHDVVFIHSPLYVLPHILNLKI